MTPTSHATGRLPVVRSAKSKSSTITAVTVALIAVAATACDTQIIDRAPQPARVAITVREAGGPALYIQNLDGTEQQRIHFDGVRDDIPGNEPPDILPVTDESILAMGPVRWSPDGNWLAVVVTVAFDQSQVVVMNADGTDMRAASPNPQIILSNVAWSPDGRRIAYTMSTLPHASGVDVFMTDLETNRVTRLSTDANLGLPGVGLAWSGDGGQVYVSRVTGSDGAPLFEYSSAVNRIDVTTLQQTTVAEDMAGQVAAIADGGAYVVLIRRSSQTSSGYLEHLVRRDLGAGVEETLTADALLAWASLTVDGRSVLYTVAPAGTADMLHYFMLPLSGGEAQRLGWVDVNTNSADVRPSL